MVDTHNAGGERVQHVEGVALLRVDDRERVVRPGAEHRCFHYAYLAADHNLETFINIFTYLYFNCNY